MAIITATMLNLDKPICVSSLLSTNALMDEFFASGKHPYERLHSLGQWMCRILSGDIVNLESIVEEGKPWPSVVYCAWICLHWVFDRRPYILVRAKLEVDLTKISGIQYYQRKTILEQMNAAIRDPDRRTAFAVGGILSHLHQHSRPESLIPLMMPRHWLYEFVNDFVKKHDPCMLLLSNALTTELMDSDILNLLDEEATAHALDRLVHTKLSLMDPKEG